MAQPATELVQLTNHNPIRSYMDIAFSWLTIIALIFSTWVFEDYWYIACGLFALY